MVLNTWHYPEFEPITVTQGRSDDIGMSDTWYDEVDLLLGFEDTAILYVICIIFWLLAALRFVFYTKQPSLPFSKLNVTKIVSEYC